MPDKLDIRYIEQIGGHCGPAWIARVTTSKSGRTVYFNGMALKRGGRGFTGNHFNLESGRSYWVSGVKKRGTNRHWAGGGIIWIEESALDYFYKHTGTGSLHPKYFKVIPDLPQTDPAKFVETENEALDADAVLRQHKKHTDVIYNVILERRKAYRVKNPPKPEGPGTYR